MRGERWLLGLAVLLATSCSGGGGSDGGAERASRTTVDVGPTGETWLGYYRGSVRRDCGPIGVRRGDLDGTFTIEVASDRTSTLSGSKSVTGFCKGSGVEYVMTPITVVGKRTRSGFEFASTLWGRPGMFTMLVTGKSAAGTLTGAVPSGTISLTFEAECATC